MTTFSRWLVEQTETGQPWSPLGVLWKESAKVRPRVSGTQAVADWLVGHAAMKGMTAEDAQAAMSGAKAAFDGARAHLQAVPLAGPPAAAEQSPPEPGPSAAHPAAMPAIMASLGRIEGSLSDMYTGLSSRLDDIVARLDVAEAERAPLRELLSELGAAEGAADEADAAYEAGDLDQADAVVASVHPGLLYGDHHAPPGALGPGPLVQAMGLASDPALAAQRQAIAAEQAGHIGRQAAWQAAYEAGEAGEE